MSKYAVIIEVETQDHMNFFNCLWSLYECNPEPDSIIVVCENYTSKLEPIFELKDLHKFDFIKLWQVKENPTDTSLVYAMLKDRLQGQYVLTVKDNYVFKRADIFEQMRRRHSEGYTYLRNSNHECFSFYYPTHSDSNNKRQTSDDKFLNSFLRKL